MKLSKIYNFNIINLFIFIILTIILYSNCFKFTTDPDDLIIKFNIENVKFKNNEYVTKVKNRVKNEMKIIKRKLSRTKIPDDLDTESPVKIYEIQQSNSNETSHNNNFNHNKNENNFEEEDLEMNEFEEKDMIRSKNFSS